MLNRLFICIGGLLALTSLYHRPVQALAGGFYSTTFPEAALFQYTTSNPAYDNDENGFYDSAGASSVLIGATTALTNAHAFEGINSNPFVTGFALVVSVYEGDSETPTAYTIPIAAYTIHPQYKYEDVVLGKIEFDVAVLQLAPDTSKKVAILAGLTYPPLLDHTLDDSYIGDLGQAVGFGITTGFADIPKALGMPIQWRYPYPFKKRDGTMAVEAYETTTKNGATGQSLNWPRQTVMDEDFYVASCTGDSGGPVFLEDAAVDGLGYYLAALMAWNDVYACNGPESYSRAPSVGPLYNWIADTITWDTLQPGYHP